ncbi:MAG TPA: diguanylate cyclase [Candidatus Brocadiales bacterium]|nr:diguanylate cyclase [Candidatus Brocadiales bacterium]
MNNKEVVGILVVDDDEIARRLLLDTLSENGYSVETATNVKDALEKLNQKSFNAILTDIKMPDIDALELLRTVKTTHPDIPVIVMTGYGSRESAIALIKTGAYDYITKPIDLDELMIAIERSLEKHKLEAQTKQLIEKNGRLESLVVRDSLTGLYNHKHLHDMLRIEFGRARRYHEPLSCMMIDIDHFKVVNDTHGHQFGDFVLTSLAKLFHSIIRDVDVVARYGGEEFFIILPKTNLEGAHALGEKIRETVHAHNLYCNGRSAIISISIGISSISDRDVYSKDDLIKHADNALYEAKKRGRNRVCRWDEVKLPVLEGVAEELDREDDLCQKFRQIAINTKYTFLEAVKGFVKLVEAKDEYEINHSTKVSKYAIALAKELRVPDEEIEVIKNAALLHDIGKVGVPQNILLKKERLTEAEYNLIKKHCTIGTRIVSKAPFFEREAPLVLYHQERYDGTGYPSGLKGIVIPDGARILAIADAYDAMTTDRAYRRKYSKEAVINELKKLSGVQFDPDKIEPFLKLVKSGGLHSVEELLMER